jgi:NAD(P)-dependent dehydrogenase (short-subunit alcohol dehydrogenase family)
MDYRDRHVVVTGGTGALGTAVVGALLEAGVFCHVPHLPADRLDRFPHRGHARLRLVADVELTDEAAVARLFEGVPALWGSIHIAGGFAMSGIAETGKLALLQMLETNLVTCHLCCAAAVRAMRRTGAGGRIVNVASRQALEPRLGAGMVPYAASKAAVAALTQALAEEVAKDEILVNAVAPSVMDTAANRAAMPKAEHALWPKVEEVAATIFFLASPQNRVTRGGVVPVYGKS